MEKEERKLTPAEQKRKEAFEKGRAEMEEKRYRRKADFTVGIVKGNIISIIIMVPFAALAAGLFFLLNLRKSVDYSLGRD